MIRLNLRMDNDLAFSNDSTQVNVIDIPRKVWLPKVKSQYKPEAQYSDVDEGHFIFECYGKAVFRSTPSNSTQQNITQV